MYRQIVPRPHVAHLACSPVDDAVEDDLESSDDDQVDGSDGDGDADLKADELLALETEDDSYKIYPYDQFVFWSKVALLGSKLDDVFVSYHQVN